MGAGGVVALVAAAAACVAAPAATAAPACAAPSLVKAALGVAVGKPRVQRTGPVTVCSYPAGGNPRAVLVRVQTGQTLAGFTAGRKQFDLHGEPTKTVAGLGGRAYSSVLGSGRFATGTIVVLKGSTELLVTAGSVGLPRVVALARKLLPTL